MNKIMHMNIGGSPFSIDEDAYFKLDHYLDSISKKFTSQDTRKEIMQDIESRIAELLQEKMQQRTIVDLRMVSEVMNIMGSPQEFADGRENNHNEPLENEWGFRPGKKLYRDPYNKKIAGVCSGLSHYLGIEDPIFMRIAFLIGLTAGGATLLLYFALWILTKPAVTSSEQLQMKGMPVNIDNIAAKVEEKFAKFSDKIETLIEKTQRKS
ncbi:MAG: PspC domain-containing protein [Saprospiraceae bacterium]|nr:PspC domain-containing protein [Saprospiraceae bacterium]HMW38895.1 PspC domain-containing protein [Saprospiraceae bacterium]HMX86957.1 PspC domain-containing protein [Saprospiraceae bacterium]HMZ39864.1 PspC domain-containing protein [Saprospiraceae bacterium]HNA65570.1 PspC domain-containing protein [Saprospiraceae bacterium]